MDIPESDPQTGADLAQVDQEFAATIDDVEGKSKTNERTEGSSEEANEVMILTDDDKTTENNDDVTVSKLQCNSSLSMNGDVTHAEENSEDDQIPDISRYLQNMFKSLGLPELAESYDKPQSGPNTSLVKSQLPESYDPLHDLEVQEEGASQAELIGIQSGSREGGFSMWLAEHSDDMSSEMSLDDGVKFGKTEEILYSDANDNYLSDTDDDNDFADNEEDYFIAAIGDSDLPNIEYDDFITAKNDNGFANIEDDDLTALQDDNEFADIEYNDLTVPKDDNSDSSFGPHTPIYVLATLHDPYDEITVTVKRDPVMGLGFEFAAAVGMGIYVMDVVPFGPADGILQHGDRIVSVNGKDIYHSMFCNAADVLADGDSFKIIFRRFMFISDALEQ